MATSGRTISNAVLAILLLCGAGETPAWGQIPATDEHGGTAGEASGAAAPAGGSGIMVAGELWDSFMPPNAGAYYGEASQALNAHLFRIGNFDRTWSTPTHMWPGGWTNGNFWGKDMYMVEFNPDTAWNPPRIGGQDNPAFRANSGSQYAFGSFNARVAGATDPARNYKRETRWVDPIKRDHAVYEAAWPTNIGVDVKVKIHQFTLNWNNFNDAIIVELTLTNTGDVDINADNVVERRSNVIRALTVETNGEFMCSYNLTRSGQRVNRFGATRAIGYVGDPDPKGSPWDIMVGFPGESAAGAQDMGLNDFPLRFYSDIWSGWSWLAVKRGGGPSDSLHLCNDKPTIYGTHPVGMGSERGWYTSAGQGRGINVREFRFDDPKSIHTASMGVWYKDGGKTRGAVDPNRLAPNPNFFSTGVAGDPTTFVPKTSPVRPNGDRKLYSDESPGAFEVNPYESGWTKGFTASENFDGDMFSGVGPFSLAVGESITLVWAEAGGYRLAGVQNAIAAARWAFEHGYALPDLPSLPDVMTVPLTTTTARVYWDNRAESHPRFAGYKIYKTSTGKLFNWLDAGTRGLDNYWKTTTPYALQDSMIRPVNPKFGAQKFVRSGIGVADSWGPYDLAAVIPRSQLSQFSDRSETNFHYSLLDTKVLLGFKYWYYVAAYTGESTPIDLGPSYAGTNSPVSTTLETPNINRNGASGLWANTYPFADLNPFYPTTKQGLKEIGAGVVIKSARVEPGALARRQTAISVRPNPYKKKAFFDNPLDQFDHKVVFYNLPPRATITILDVSGQLVQEIAFASNGPGDGSVPWNLFSKDGIEVASGLYVYVVEYDGGQHVGYLSILR